MSLRIFAIALLLVPTAMAAQGSVTLQASQRNGEVVLKAPVEACHTAQLDGRAVQRSPDNAFHFEAVTPGPHQLQCGGSLELYLLDGARLQITLASGAPPRFTGRGAALNRYLYTPRAMATEFLAELWGEDLQEFRRGWKAAYDEDVRQLRRVSGAPAAFRERESMRLRYRFEFGRMVYPYFHWRESAAKAVVRDSSLAVRLEELSLGDPRWMSLPEHAMFVEAFVHERARELLDSDSTLQRGDARWLRAEFRAASMLPDSSLRHRTMARLLTTHVDDNGSRGIDSVYGPWIEAGADSAARGRVDSLVAVDREMQRGHTIAMYQTIDGVDLAVHVLRAELADTTAVTPAMLWFHGGSWSTSTWWHSPGVLGALRQNGVTVVAVELRTSSRFNTGPLEQVEDAVRAYEWTRAHAPELRIDPNKIGVAGFSSGATLALILGTRGLSLPPGDTTAAAIPGATADATGVRRYPSTVIAVGACVDPGGFGEDGYYRKMVGARAPLVEFTPFLAVGAGQPPTLLVHATQDEYCDIRLTNVFVRRSQAAGNSTTLTVIEGAGHFFGFYYPLGQREMRRAIEDALSSWGWRREPPD